MIVYVIGETNDERKTKWYKNLISDSIPNVKMLKDISSINSGKEVWYFYK